MQLVVQVRIHTDTDTGDDGVGELIEIATIHRDGPLTSSTVGMSIEEAKQILAGIDDVVVTSQTSRAVAAAGDCADCGRGFASKDARQIVMRSLYGTHHVESPRWWTCPCAGDRSTFSPLSKMLVGRSTPELALVEAKLAAHISYPAAPGLLEELFPTGRRIHRNEIRRTVTHLAERLDGELDDDEFNYMNPRAIDRSTVPDMPMTQPLMAATSTQAIRSRGVTAGSKPCAAPSPSTTARPDDSDSSPAPTPHHDHASGLCSMLKGCVRISSSRSSPTEPTTSQGSVST